MQKRAKILVGLLVVVIAVGLGFLFKDSELFQGKIFKLDKSGVGTDKMVDTQPDSKNGSTLKREEKECVDSDAAINPFYEKGYVSGIDPDKNIYVKDWDSCGYPEGHYENLDPAEYTEGLVTGPLVVEKVCQGDYVQNLTFECEFGCYEGACKED